MRDLVKMSDIIRIYNNYDCDKAREEVMKLPSIDMISELEKIKEEIKDLDLEYFDEDYRAGFARGIMEFNKILNKHITTLKGEK